MEREASESERRLQWRNEQIFNGQVESCERFGRFCKLVHKTLRKYTHLNDIHIVTILFYKIE